MQPQATVTPVVRQTLRHGPRSEPCPPAGAVRRLRSGGRCRKALLALALLSALSVIGIRAATAVPLRRLATRRLLAVEAVTPPAIDGQLRDEAWKAAACIDSFTGLNGTPATQHTRALLCFDQRALYVAFQCAEADMEELLATIEERDGSLWREDCVEIFIDTNSDRTSYLQIEISPRGVVADKRCDVRNGKLNKDATWNCDGLRVATSRGNSEWCVEAAIPFAGLGAHIKSDRSWRFNLTRNETPHGELSSWSAMHETFHDPRGFGLLTLVDDACIEGLLCGYRDRLTRVLEATVRNGKRPCQLSVELTVVSRDDVRHQEQHSVSLQAGEKRDIALDYPLADDSGHTATLVLRDAESKKKLDELTDDTPPAYFTVRDEFATPHTPWGKPLAGQPLRVLFLTPYFTQRDLVELSQRLSLEARAVSFLASRWDLPTRPSAEQYLELVRRELAAPLDAIVIDRTFVHEPSRHGSERYDAVSLTDDVLQTIRTKLASGTGLVLFSHGDLPPQWEGTVLKPARPMRGNPGTLVPTTPHFVSQCVPLAAFESLSLPLLETDEDAILAVGSRPFLTATTHGDGRVLVFAGHPNGIVPAAARAPTYRHWDYYHAFFARCLVWASRREPAVQLTALRVEPADVLRANAGQAKVSLALRNTGARADVSVECRFRDPYSTTLATATRVLTVGAETARDEFPIPAKLADGAHFADIIVKHGDRVVDWGSAMFHVRAARRIADVVPERPVLQAGHRVRGQVILEGAQSPSTAAYAKGRREARLSGRAGYPGGWQGQALLPGNAALFYSTEQNFAAAAGSVELMVALGEPQSGANGSMANWWWRTAHAFRVLHYPERQTVSFQVRPTPGSNEGAIALGFSTADWQKDDWHHVVWTWGPDGLHAFVDGEPRGQVGPPAVGMPTQVQGELHVGHANGYAPTTARIDEFAVHDRPLTPADAAVRFSAHKPPSGDTMLLYAPFDLPASAVAGDHDLLLQLLDRHDRLVDEQWTKGITEETKLLPFEFLHSHPLARGVRVEACLFDENGLVDRKRSAWIELADRALDDFLYFCWDWSYSRRHPDYVRDWVFRRMYDQGVDGTDGASSVDFKLVAGLPFPAAKRNTVDGKTWYDIFHELRAGYARTQDKQFLVRRPCLSDPDTWRKYREKIAATVARHREHLPVAYGLADENTLTFESIPLDLCFSEHCLRGFRQWAARQYETLAALNRSWATEFASWDSVMPMTADEVKDHPSYAPWADHRAYMDTVFAQAYRHAAEAVRSVDPTARISTSGTRPPFPYSACDWWQILPYLDHLMPYPRLYDQGEMQRSFARLPTMMCSGFGATGAFQKYLIWYAALHGSSSVIFSKVTSCIAADLSVYPDQPLRTREMRELQDGIGKAIMQSERQHDGVAIHYSPASLRAEWIRAFGKGSKLGYEGPLARDRRGWLRLLEAVCRQYQFLSYAQIERGALVSGEWKVLIMPSSLALSPAEAQAIRSFVERGGTLIATAYAGTFDEHCSPQRPGLLDELFGMAQGRDEPTLAPAEVYLADKGPAAVIRDVVPGGAIALQGATAIGWHAPGKSAPAVCRQAVGRGVAYFLNFLYDFKADCRNPGKQQLDPGLLGLLEGIVSDAGVERQVTMHVPEGPANAEVVRFRHGPIEFVCVLRQWSVPEGAPETIHPELRFSRPGWVHDVRSHRAYGFCDRVTTELGLGETRVFSVLPYEVKAVRVVGPTRVLPGGTLTCRVEIDTGPHAPADHVIHLDVIDPAGNPKRYYARNLVSRQGSATTELKLAYNDQPGQWQIVARDVASATRGRHSFDVLPQRAGQKVRIQARTAWELTGIVEEMRHEGVAIPSRIEQLQWKVCREINLQRVHDSGTQAEDVAEMRDLLCSLPTPEGAPTEYLPAGAAINRVRAPEPQLPVLRATGYLEDRILGVGLKSYPYVVDWNADGRKDLLVGDHDGFIYIYLNEGTAAAPAFGRATRLKCATSGEDFVIHFNPKIDLADLAGDGKLDLVVGSHAGKAVLFENIADTQGHFAFDLSRHHELRSPQDLIDVGNYGYPELVDWNNDNVLDLLMGEEEGGLILFKGRHSKREPRFHTGRDVPDIAGSMYPCPEMVDWNNDGLPDVLLGDRDGTLRLFLNAGEPGRPQFSAPRQVTGLNGHLLDAGRLSHPHVTDWNGDRRKDLVVGNDDGDILVWTNVGTDASPLFERCERLTDGGGELVCGVHPVIDIVDWNGDGNLDLLAGGETERVRVYLNLGTARAPKFDTFHVLEDIVYTPAALCGDNREERTYWENRALEFTTEYVGNLAPAAVDWNEDGAIDLVLGGYTGLVYLFANTGPAQPARFAPGQALMTGDRPLRVAGFSTPVVTDWNHDDRKDLVCGDFLGRVHVFVNVGTNAAPRFERGERLQVGGRDFTFGPRSIPEVADYDDDGLPDVLVGNRAGKLVALLNVGTRQQPRFEQAEHVRDDSPIWRELYGGGWVSPHPQTMPLYRRRAGGVDALDVVATACPRVLDWDGDGEDELLVSHRFGRVFVFAQAR